MLQVEMSIPADTELFLFLNRDLGLFADQFFSLISSKWIAIPLYLFIGWMMYRKYGNKILIILGAVAILIFVSDQLSVAFKNLIERPRPCHEDSLAGLVRTVNGRCGGQYGFYSSHASNTLAIALFTIGLLRIPALTAFLFIWCVAVGYSRIYLGVHYPVDVLCGWIAGALLGIVAAHILKNRLLSVVPEHLE